VHHAVDAVDDPRQPDADPRDSWGRSAQARDHANQRIENRRWAAAFLSRDDCAALNDFTVEDEAAFDGGAAEVDPDRVGRG
jgi:hypothetical protein